ncbi:pyridoxamine 5'-phosphate oxidase family protein [Spirulina sp. CS-785/01]|uniref:HugZ family pyridoxamine 5'-phosphate oxidase n=1 Tax=Spirulina sp. CS-785/01 TaxID=3021716 RepID=UPI00232EE9EA|nr:pyridoxamine 5'-phosphate oxidase family protein [Spirulina sp. CS-785/01]MDB9314137.1 pyridoxamine 5'-phosphate oxidase family protein [Spirulina sp. CS-785/01]
MSKLEQAQALYNTFTEQFQSLVLSTADDHGTPNGSYAPFVQDEGKNFYIFVSGLSAHTQNLSINPKVSVLFIEDEAQAEQPFARRRLSFDCTATVMERETEEWEAIAEQFTTKFGEIIDIFRSLPDFRLVKLTPQQGRFVIGFGAAYQVTGDNLQHLHGNQ